MLKKSNISKILLMLILILVFLAFLWPRSFLGSIDEEIRSVSVVIIKNTLEHEQTTYTFNIGDPEFHE